MSATRSLQLQHRLEEVCSRFGVPLEVTDAGCRIRFDRLAKVRFEGRRLSAHRAAELGQAAGLVADEAGVGCAWSQAPAEAEDALLALFERLLQADPEAFLRMPEPTIQTPADGSLPQSKVWLDRFYGDGFAPREKKPAVVDLRRCQGAYLRSVDDDALQIVDAASQIASLAAGFRPGLVQAALDEGRFDPYLVSAPSPVAPASRPAIDAYTDALLELAPPGAEHVCFVNGGAEANEKAFHLARLNGPGGHRIFAFKGSFHGRTLLSLYSTWNPVKREPYQIPGFETEFLPTPVSDDPYADPLPPKGWVQAWATPGADRSELGGDGSDTLLAAEVAALSALEAQIQGGEGLACIIEPYQCEGGDQSPTRRFFLGLRALTRGHGLPLIFDEVQSGFGLSGAPFWHQQFKLIDAAGRPDGPDLVTGAKRAQVGYVLSRWPDPEPTPCHAASLARGLEHLRLISTRVGHARLAKAQLTALSQRWSGIVTRPRVHGDAFAFDMPSREAANHLIGQRFYRGYMVYIAGERTLRYRLNRGMKPIDVKRIFDVIDRSLEALQAQAGGPGPDLGERMGQCKPPAWAPPEPVAPRRLPVLSAVVSDRVAADRVLRVEGELSTADRAAGEAQLGLRPRGTGPLGVDTLAGADAAAFEAAVGVSLLRFAADRLGTRLEVIDPMDFTRHAAAIATLEADAYEPARRDALAYLRGLVSADGGRGVFAFDPDGLVGMAYGAPLELWPGRDGPRQDPNRGRENTFYSADLTVASRARGRGIGSRLRLAGLAEALRAKRPDGRPRYQFVTGRNRVGEADTMWAMNERFGAYEVALYSGQYGEQTGLARYYRIPLRRHDRRAFESGPEVVGPTDFADGVHQPTGAAHPLLCRARSLGVFDEPSLTKLTVSNFITAPFVRYAEWLQTMTPKGTGHIYFTSSPDEMVDKSVRALKHNRKAASTCVAIEGGYVGHTTAASRSLSDPWRSGARDGYFGWPSVPHPNDTEACIAALDECVRDAGGPSGIIALYVEAIQARTGRVLTAEAWGALCAWRARTGVPIALVETSSGFYRSGTGHFWWVDGQAEGADVVLWYGGGQIGHIFSTTETFVAKPLTLISTWDGDELSACRLLWQFYATQGMDHGSASARLSAALEGAGLAPTGRGLYRVCEVGADRADAIQEGLAERGIQVGRPTPDAIAFVPPLTAEAGDFEALQSALVEVLS